MTVQLESFEQRRKFVAVDSDEARKSLLVLAANRCRKYLGDSQTQI